MTSMQPLKQTSLGEAVAGARAQRKLSLSAASNLLSVSASYLHRIERSEVKAPSPRILERLSLHYELDYGTLMQLAGYKVEASPGRQSRSRTTSNKELERQQITPSEAELLIEFLNLIRKARADKAR